LQEQINKVVNGTNPIEKIRIGNSKAVLKQLELKKSVFEKLQYRKVIGGGRDLRMQCYLEKTEVKLVDRNRISVSI